MTRDEIIFQARQWLYVPFVHRGRTERGLDCLGLGIVVAKYFGVPHEDMPDYSHQPHPRRLVLTTMRKWLKPMPITGNLTGCIGVFAQVKLPCHVGFFTMKEYRPHILHVRIDAGVAEEPYDDNPVTRSLRAIDVLAFPDMEI